MKRFTILDQTEFGTSKRLPTTLLDLIPKDSVVLAKRIQDADLPELDHPTPSSTRTLHKASRSEFVATPLKIKQVPKKKKADKKRKDLTISPPPKRSILLHTTNSQKYGGDNTPPVGSEEPKVIHLSPQARDVSKVKGVKFASTATPS